MPFLLKKENNDIFWCFDGLPENFKVLLNAEETGPIEIELQNIYNIKNFSYKWYDFAGPVKSGCIVYLKNPVLDQKKHHLLYSITIKQNKKYIMEYIYELMDITRDYSKK